MSYKNLIQSAAIAIIITAFSASAFAAAAKDNYRFYCSSCHGLEGKGDGPNNTKTQPVKPRNHTNAAKMGKLTDKEIMQVIMEGGAATNRSRMMPPFGNTLTKKEISELKDYLRVLCKCTAK